MYGYEPHVCKGVFIMPGPLLAYRPDFPSDFVEQARRIVQKRAVAYHLRQRAQLVLLLHDDPLLSHHEIKRSFHLIVGSGFPLQSELNRIWKTGWSE